MRAQSKTIALAATALALGAPGAAVAAPCPGADLRPSAGNVLDAAQATICLINRERTRAGLRALSDEAHLRRASGTFARRMVERRFFDHVAPDGSNVVDRLKASGYLSGATSWVVGENIAWGESYLGSPAEIVRAWMKSPGHRANILRASFEDVGIGIALGTPRTADRGATYAADFGRRRPRRAPGTDTTGSTAESLRLTASRRPRPRGSAVVRGAAIERVTFYVNGRQATRLTSAGKDGAFRLRYRAGQLRNGSNRVKAKVKIHPPDGAATLRTLTIRVRR